MKAIERNVHQLCQTIDRLEYEVEYWKTKYEEQKDSYNIIMNQSLDNAKKGVANALMFALSVKDDSEGNLVINKEDRKTLAKVYESNES